MWDSVAVAAVDREVWVLWAWRAMFVVALVMALVAWYWFRRRQLRLLEQVLRVIVTNQGNIRSRYELEAESPDGALCLAFAAEGQSLVPSVKEELKEWWKRVWGAVGKGMRAGSSTAGFLDSVGNLLPRSVGRPLLQSSREIRQGQLAVRRAEQTPRRVAQLQSKVKNIRRKPEKQAVEVLAPQAETEHLEPGESLTLRLLVMPVSVGETRLCPVVVRSRSLEQRGGEWLVTEEQVQVVGLTPFQRYGPYLVIPAVALLVLFVSSLVCSLF